MIKLLEENIAKTTFRQIIKFLERKINLKGDIELLKKKSLIKNTITLLWKHFYQ